MTADKKTLIYMCNRYPSPQGLLIGASIYNKLTNEKRYYRLFVRALKMLISVSGGGLTIINNMVLLEASKTSKYERSVDRLIKQTARAGQEFNFDPGKPFHFLCATLCRWLLICFAGEKTLKGSLADCNNGSGPPQIKESDDQWFMSLNIFNEIDSFAEKRFVDAIKELLKDESAGPDCRVPWPQTGSGLQTEDYIIVSDLMDLINNGSSVGPAVAAVRRMGDPNLNHALITLQKRTQEGRNLLVKVTGPIYPAVFVTNVDGLEPGKYRRSTVYPSLFMVKRKTPCQDAYLLLRSYVDKDESNDDPVANIAPHFLAACGDFTGQHRQISFDDEVDPVGVTIDPDERYNIRVENPNYRPSRKTQGGFRRASMIDENPISTRQDLRMDQHQKFIHFDKESNLEREVFKTNAMTLGLSEEEACRMAAMYTVSAMRKRSECYAGGSPVTLEAEPQPEPFVVRDTFGTSVEEEYPLSEDGAGDLYGTAAQEAPNEEEVDLYGTAARGHQIEEDVDLVVASGDLAKHRTKKRGRLRNRFVDDEAAGSDDSGDEVIESENEEDRAFLDDASVESEPLGNHAMVDQMMERKKSRVESSDEESD